MATRVPIPSKDQCQQQEEQQQQGHGSGNRTGAGGAGFLSTNELDRLLATSMAQLTVEQRETELEYLHGVISTYTNPERLGSQQEQRQPQQRDGEHKTNEKGTNKAHDSDKKSDHEHDHESVGPASPVVGPAEQNVNELLDELDNQLNAMKKGTVYERAEQMSSSYVQDRNFRLMFLRSNRYNPQNAARNIIRFYDSKLELFGPTKLVLDITFEDLNEDDRECLKSGCRQVLPVRDNSGRTILLELAGLRSYKTLQSELRATFYFYMTLVQRSPETQINGVVVVLYRMGKFQEKSDASSFFAHTMLALAAPLLYAGVHLCIDDYVQYAMATFHLVPVPKRLRARFKLHYGSHMEVQYKLSGYGIHPSCLPLHFDRNDVEVDLDAHMRWYKNCEALDKARNIQHDNPQQQHSNNNNHHANSNNNSNNNTTTTNTTNIIPPFTTDQEATNGTTSVPWIGPSSIISVSSTRRAESNTNSRMVVVPADPIVDRDSTATIDTSNVAAVVVWNPDPKDVLFGRNRSNMGNKRVREIVNVLSGEYDRSGRGRKALIALSIVECIHNEGGRFLRPKSDGSWEVVSTEEAQKKVSKHFRNNRRR